jgi:hypothetical protein
VGNVKEKMMLKILDPLLRVKTDNRNALKIIGWWELRRILYNLIVFIALAIFLYLVPVFVEVPPDEDVIAPIAIVGFVCLCNLFYTLGWIVELNDRHKGVGQDLFKLGLVLTLAVILLPLIIEIFLWAKGGFVKVD